MCRSLVSRAATCHRPGAPSRFPANILTSGDGVNPYQPRARASHPTRLDEYLSRHSQSRTGGSDDAAENTDPRVAVKFQLDAAASTGT